MSPLLQVGQITWDSPDALVLSHSWSIAPVLSGLPFWYGPELPTPLPARRMPRSLRLAWAVGVPLPCPVNMESFITLYRMANPSLYPQHWTLHLRMTGPQQRLLDECGREGVDGL